MKVYSIVTSTSIKGEHDHKNVKGHKETVGIWGFFVFFWGKFQSTILFKNMLPREDTFLFKQNTYYFL